MHILAAHALLLCSFTEPFPVPLSFHAIGVASLASAFANSDSSQQFLISFIVCLPFYAVLYALAFILNSRKRHRMS